MSSKIVKVGNSFCLTLYIYINKEGKFLESKTPKMALLLVNLGEIESKFREISGKWNSLLKYRKGNTDIPSLVK